MNDHELPATDIPTARLTIAGRSLRSRLILGTGKYRTPEIMAACHRESSAEIIAVAVRRVNLGDCRQNSILSHLTDHSYFLLPNTAGCNTDGPCLGSRCNGREISFRS